MATDPKIELVPEQNGDEERLSRALISMPREHRAVTVLSVLVDILVLELCLYLAYLVRLETLRWFPIPLEANTYIGITAGVLIIPFAYYLFDLYPGYGLTEVERIRRRVLATMIVFVTLIAWDYLVQDGQWSRGVLLAAGLMAAILVPLGAAMFKKLMLRAGLWGTPVVIIGAGDAGRLVASNMRANADVGLVPAGFLDYDPDMRGRQFDGVPVLGTLAIAGTLSRHIRMAAIAMPELDGNRLAHLSSQLPFPHVIILPDLSGLPSAWVSPRDLGGILGLEVKKNLLLRHNQIIKRIMDYVISVPLLIIAFPALLLMTMLVFAISPTNPIYSQERVGRRGKPFRMLKIRTMHADAEERLKKSIADDPDRRVEWLTTFKLKDDPRILPYIGNFLRMSSLDELPQIWNVLRGDMSLVGPRPFPQYHLDAFDDEFRSLRESVRPGLTGLWQVEVRSDSDFDKQRFFDSYFIRNWSIWLDIHILFRTIFAVSSGKGAR